MRWFKQWRCDRVWMRLAKLKARKFMFESQAPGEEVSWDQIEQHADNVAEIEVLAQRLKHFESQGVTPR